jgi:ABC-type transporter Mla MlaB component
MLRITVQNNPRIITFQLEGRLAGPWLQELEKCWHESLSDRQGPILRVDLTGMTSIDTEGKACLAAMHRQGAEFVAADCLTKAIVTEISQCDDASLKRKESNEGTTPSPPALSP